MAGISDKTLKAEYSENKLRFNGKELESHEFIDGGGMEAYDYGARMQDPQLGRMFSIDRYSEKYQMYSPYQYAANAPMKFVDVNGDSLYIQFSFTTTDDNGKETKSNYKLYYQAGEDGNYDFYDQNTGKVYDGPRTDFLDDTKIALGFLINNGLGEEIIHFSGSESDNVTLKQSKILGFEGWSDKEKTIYFNTHEGIRESPDQQGTTPAIALFHEIGHATDYYKDSYGGRSKDEDEQHTVDYYENKAIDKINQRQGTNFPRRGDYTKGRSYWTTGVLSNQPGPNPYETPAPKKKKH